MSKIGNQPVKVPEGVEVKINITNINVKGKNGELTVQLHPSLKLEQKDGMVTIERKGDYKQVKSMHGTLRSLLQNAVLGVSSGFTKELEMVGVGYRSKIEGKNLVLTVGFSHFVNIEPKEGIMFEVENNTMIKVTGHDKQLVGETAALIRKVRPPEPYKGKGIRYKGEVVRKKQGKAAKVAGE